MEKTMYPAPERLGLSWELWTAARTAFITIAVCGLLYPALIWAIGQTLTPHAANGSVLRDAQGKVIGSELIAQGFSRPEYFWPRPSAVEYNAAGSGGSNLSPTSPELRRKAEAQLARFSADSSHPLPLDLAAASGSGLDPQITLAAAEYQAERVAKARHMPTSKVVDLLKEQQRGGLVNVLAANLALDTLGR
jgi:K+-transporting ATPase ATPase C chain